MILHQYKLQESEIILQKQRQSRQPKDSIKLTVVGMKLHFFISKDTNLMYINRKDK